MSIPVAMVVAAVAAALSPLLTEMWKSGARWRHRRRMNRGLRRWTTHSRQVDRGGL